jgi:hypothetical protein
MLLVVGVLLFMIGVVGITGIPIIYAIPIPILIYFGIKQYVVHKRKTIEKEIGEGLCADCGCKVYNKKCPNCNSDDN